MSFIRKAFSNPFDRVKDLAEKLQDNITKEITHNLNDISDIGVKGIGIALKKIGIHDTLDKYWQKYGRPVFKFSANQINTIKKKWGSKIPYLNEIIVLLRIDPRLNKIINNIDTTDRLISALANNDFKEVGRIGVNYGATFLLAKALPSSKRVHYLRWAHKYDVLGRVKKNGLDKEAHKLSQSLNERGGKVSDGVAKKMLQKVIVGL
jgi:hypothetical protein